MAWFASFPLLDRIYLLAAFLGGLGLVGRLILMFAGGVLDGEGFGVDDHGHDGHLDGGHGFQALSIHGLSSFFLMFGLVGLALSRQGGAVLGVSLPGGIAAGLAALVVIARVFRLAHRLQSSGNLDARAAAGCRGTVYMRIPAGGTGRVTVKIGQRLREMDALNAAGTELPTGTPVRVLRVEQSLAVVQPLSSTEP